MFCLFCRSMTDEKWLIIDTKAQDQQTCLTSRVSDNEIDPNDKPS